MKTPEHLKKSYTSFEQQAAKTAAAIPQGIDWDEVDRILERNRKHRSGLVSARPGTQTK